MILAELNSPKSIKYHALMGQKPELKIKNLK